MMDIPDGAEMNIGGGQQRPLKQQRGWRRQTNLIAGRLTKEVGGGGGSCASTIDRVCEF